MYVIHYPTFGGPHNQVLQLSEPLSKRGWPIGCVLPSELGNGADRLRGVAPLWITPLHRLRRATGLRPVLEFPARAAGDVRRLAYIIETFGIQVVCLGGLVNPQAAVAARIAGAGVVWQLLDTFAPPRVTRLAMQPVKRLADVIMTTGERVARLHPGSEAFVPDRSFEFFPPVRLEDFARDPIERRATRAAHGIADDELLVGTVGNVNPMKGHDRFISAAVQVAARSGQRVRFMIVGHSYPQHRAWLGSLIEAARAGGLTVGTDFLHVEPEASVAPYVRAMDLFWMTSEPRAEGLPTAIEEAMAAGVPVIAQDSGGIRELIDDGVTGFLVKARDTAGLVDRSLELLSDAGRRRALGQAALARAEACFSSEACADVHVSAFEKAASLGWRPR